jgi:ABC-type multidrug transport system permease subunit
MNRVLLIGHNDFRIFLRNRFAFVWLLAVPLAFVYFMGFANRGPGDPANPRPAVLVENLDPGFLGRAFLDELGAQGLRTVSPTNRADAQRGLRVPADFTDRVLGGQPARVAFFTVKDSGDAAAAMIELRLVRALIALDSHLLELAAAHSNAPPTEETLRQIRQRPNPVALDSRFAGRQPIPVGFNLSLPGVLVMYLMLNLLVFGGNTVAAERRSGLLRRFFAHPGPKRALVFGKIYGLMLLALLQIVVFLLLGRFLFKVNLGPHLGAILLTLLVYSWVAASLGVLVGSLIRAEDKVTGLCVLASLVMAALGGCWWPLEIVPDFAKTLAHAVPTGWALDALHQLITFGAGLDAATRPLTVLTLCALAANLAAMKWFRA